MSRAVENRPAFTRREFIITSALTFGVFRTGLGHDPTYADGSKGHIASADGAARLPAPVIDRELELIEGVWRPVAWTRRDNGASLHIAKACVRYARFAPDSREVGLGSACNGDLHDEIRAYFGDAVLEEFSAEVRRRLGYL